MPEETLPDMAPGGTLPGQRMRGMRQGSMATSPGCRLIGAVVCPSSVMLSICAAPAFGFDMAWERLPPRMAAWMVTLTSVLPMLLPIDVMLIVLGKAVEGTAALIIPTPIFVPVVMRFGIHFGIVLLTNLTIAAAALTPAWAAK